MTKISRWMRIVVATLVVAVPLSALAQGEPIGIVVMHGKGGSPTRYVVDLARALEGKGLRVANVEMPWSGKLNYSLPVSSGEETVAAALDSLRGEGARKLFVAGHSLGGAFALHIAGRIAVDGIIAIAPGGNGARGTPRRRFVDCLFRDSRPRGNRRRTCGGASRGAPRSRRVRAGGDRFARAYRESRSDRSARVQTLRDDGSERLQSVPTGARVGP